MKKIANKAPVTMMFLWLLRVILSTICTVSGALDQTCIDDNCPCCVDRVCGYAQRFNNSCLNGCINGHRGARCYELCQYSNCKSCGGTGPTRECTECYDGLYLGPNKNCTSHCPSNCKSCTSSTRCTECKEGFYDEDGSTTCRYAHCPTHCECNGQGDCVSCKKGYYEKSTSCTKQCPMNCLTCESKDSCNECKDGFYNKPSYGVRVNFQCSDKCRDRCLQCQSKDNCSKCINGAYGNTCQKNCSVGCKDRTCLIDSGQCTCAKNFTGDRCMKCVDGKYGLFCDKTCSKFCKGNKCNRETGHCNDCINEYLTGDTCETCILGMYGESCEKKCPENCPNSKCERSNGFCSESCTGNFNGSLCDKCKLGKYGEKCNMECPLNCAGGICIKDSGNCEKCAGNFYGKICNECNAGYFTMECNEKCSQFCYNNSCHRNTGVCTYGCRSGYTGDKCCVNSENCVECSNNTVCKKCEIGYYKTSCNEKCPEGCLGSCDISTGKCEKCKNKHFGQFCNFICSANCNFESIDHRACAESDGRCYGCRDGFFGPTCNNTCSELCVGRICRQEDGVCINGCEGSQKQPECILSEGQSGETTNLAGTVSGVVAALVAVVAGISLTVFLIKRRKRQTGSRNESIVNSALSSSSSGERVKNEGPVYASVKDKRARVADLEDVVIDETNDNELDDGAGYYNCESANMNVKVADLFSYVTKDHFDLFDKEFKNLPKPGDLSALCKVAKKPENIALNRYNGIYPFDHSRVTIPGQAKFFINACYIDGYKRSKAYIASLGPTFKHTENFTTFWKMVWHEKSDIIVMLTNLREASGMKCDQYWPEVESEQCYGHIKVKCRSLEEFAEYTVRCFTVSKGKEHRHLTQLHFTAWPDKGVPSEVTSLVEFRQRVKATPVVLDGPVIVHCSAGVGRTGTYIALDILSEQGKVEGSVNVYNCVSEMRGQRVNMVQTAEQYIFLYKVLVHTLTFGCESQTAEEIQSLAFDANSTFMNMFQTLKQEVDHEGEQDIAEREENRRNHPDKSRRNSDIPGHQGRVRLYLQRKSGNHDFINAVFIDSFKTKDLFIVAQTPQTNTVEDFLCMIYQQNTSCVIALEDLQQLSKKNDIGIYLPADNETYKCGAFTVTSLKCDNTSQYTIKKLTIKHTDKSEEKVAYHFQYTRWGNGRKIADNPGDFVQFVKDVEKYAKQRDMPNIVVHCLNGYERSGLFCVVYKLLEKLEAERQVSVVNVIRKVRAQRKLSITSVEQLKFCYQCISAYLESHHTYTNY